MLKFRSSLSFYRLFSIGSLRPASCSIIEDGKKLKLHCDGEVERRYHGVWLRHNCRCPECLPPAFQQNIVHHSHLVDLKIIDATVKGILYYNIIIYNYIYNIYIYIYNIYIYIYIYIYLSFMPNSWFLHSTPHVYIYI